MTEVDSKFNSDITIKILMLNTGVDNKFNSDVTN